MVERLLHTQEVAGSNPASRTILFLLPLGTAILDHDFRRLKAILYPLLSLKINLRSRIMRCGLTAPLTVSSSEVKTLTTAKVGRSQEAQLGNNESGMDS